jgi:hypothetical protein
MLRHVTQCTKFTRNGVRLGAVKFITAGRNALPGPKR